MTSSRSPLGLRHRSPWLPRRPLPLLLSLLVVVAIGVIAVAFASHPVAADAAPSAGSEGAPSSSSAPLPALSSWTHRGGSISKRMRTSTTQLRSPSAHRLQTGTHQPTRHWRVLQAGDEASSSTGADDSASSSTGRPRVIRPSSDDSASIIATVLTVVGVIFAVICLERLWSSCRRTIKRRQGREGFSALQQAGGVGGAEDGSGAGAGGDELGAQMGADQDLGLPMHASDMDPHEENGLQLTSVRLHDDDHL